jgi:hypothetical protein
MEKEKPEGWALQRISRRKVLKRVAAGTAVAWSAPVLTSLASPAFAQDRYAACPGCAPFSCNFATNPPCGASCLCLTHDATGACVCVGASGVCFAVGFGDICDTDADCEARGFAGHRCVELDTASCPHCDPTSSACVAPCPTEGASAGQPEVRAIRP